MGRLMTVEEIVGSVESGMTLGIGGWGSRRKPMALVRALCNTPVRDLTVISYGGADVGLLCAAGKIRKLVAPFATLDSVALEPHFRQARQNGAIEFEEYDEGMFMFGLYAAAHGLPFLPTPAGLGSDVQMKNPALKTVTDPYGGEELIAVPALRMDVAFVHLQRADARGNALYLGGDPYFDDLYTKAADRAYVSCEKLVDTGDLLKEGPVQALLVSRAQVAGVVETPNGSHFTTGDDDRRDEAFQRHYVEAAATPEGWAAFRARFLDGDEAAYQAAVRTWRDEQ
ncbi:acyl CoA--acetate/3-ketoacid CoA transferase subunit alpha [Actinocorallia sp. API 0066]|uniref:CoA transferase subunit A n=1 Tax=Actinocorallia sp. API 0066 TaxID=2896846 RepID=UPI001E5E220B|nr:CoA-transferase [Actinocorallia sp. API 0066]MCD0453764.1 acyl CoA--acetate/3-ketoacid CoA transferase subunit alpha [Actinocorallia sp. API 0066]